MSDYDSLIEYIEEKWVPGQGPRFQSDIWDKKADSFKDRPVPNPEEDEFLRMLNEIYPIGSETTVLDIGCGNGRYAIALAKTAKKVVGLDFSEKMIEYAKEKAESEGVSNTEFIVCDWTKASANDPELKNGFDVVISHMAPATGNANGLQLMMDVSKDMCVIAMPVRRNEDTINVIKKKLGQKLPSGNDHGLVYAFGLVWLNGHYPEIRYRDGARPKQGVPTEEVIKDFVRDLSGKEPLTAEEKEIVAKTVMELTDEDGLVRLPAHSRTATMFWKIT